MGSMFFVSGFKGDGKPANDGYSGRDKWVENESRSEMLAQAETHYAGHENAPLRKAIRGPGGKDVQFKDSPALGLDGSDFHFGGERVTKMKEERLEGGDVAVYWQKEGGGTYRNVWRRDRDGRHVNTGDMIRVRSF